jgi:hypothetical protein
VASKFDNPVVDADAWARRTAARLRLIHSSFSDQTFEQKKMYLEDEIEFALEDAGAADPEQRKDLLDKLSGAFPIFSEMQESTVAAAMETRPAADPLEQFLDHWNQSGSEQRSRISKALAAAGIAAAAPSLETAAAVPAELAERVKLPTRPEEIADFTRGIEQLWKELGEPSTAADFNRLFKLLGMLASATRDLHKFIWEFWRQGAPRELQSAMASGFSDPFEKIVAAYLRGDEGSSSRDLAVEIEKTKRLMLGVCVAVRRGAEEFARGHHQVFAPENIESAVTVEETAGDSSRVRDLGRKCWEKYKQLSKHMTPDAVDQEFQRVFAGVMAAWLRSRS